MTQEGADQGIVQYPSEMTRTVRTQIKRPGAGVTIDRDRLIRMREVKLLSRAQLAALMSNDDYSITPDAIAKIENGYRRPKTSTLSRMCAALDCQPEELLPVVPANGDGSRPRLPCPLCDALYGHEPGCKNAT